MLNAEIRNSLAAIIRQNGKQIARDPVGLQTLLRGEAAQYPREIGMIVNAARAGIPADIEAAGNAIYDLRPRMVQKLQDEQAFPADVAEWVVETWISALSLADATGAAAPPPQAPVAPSAPLSSPPVAPVAPPAVQAPPAPMAAPSGPPQGGYGVPGPAAPQYPQFNQFQPRPAGANGKLIGIIAACVVLVAALGVGGYFLFKPKPTTTATTSGVTGTTTGTTSGQDVFNTNGGTSGTTGGQPNPSPVPPSPQPNTTTGGDTGGQTGGTTGGDQNAPALAGTYGPTVEGANGAGMTGTLTISADSTYIMDLADQTTSVEARGKLVPQGDSLVMQSDQVTVNKNPADASKFVMGLTFAGPNKLLFSGLFADALAQKAPGAKFYWTK